MKKLLILVVLLGVSGCATFKHTAHTVNDAAKVLCEMVAEGYTPKQLDKLSPEKWCEIKEHLDPFIDHVLSCPGANK